MVESPRNGASAGVPEERAFPTSFHLQRVNDTQGYHGCAFSCRIGYLTEGKERKVISVFIGNQSNVAAIRAEKPVETSIGFTSIEGIPSLHASSFPTAGPGGYSKETQTSYAR